jgi:hypothetical protein
VSIRSSRYIPIKLYTDMIHRHVQDRLVLHQRGHDGIAFEAENVLDLGRETIRAIWVDAVTLAARAGASCILGYTLMKQVAQALDERLGAAHVQLAACN